MTTITMPWFVAAGFFASLPPSPEGWPPTDDDDDDDDRATRRDDGAWLTYSSGTVVRPLSGAMCEVEVPPESRVRLLALTALSSLDWTGLGPDDAHHIAYALDGEARRQQRDGGAAYAHRVLEVAGSTYAVNGHPLPAATLAVVQRAAALAAEWPEAPRPRPPVVDVQTPTECARRRGGSVRVDVPPGDEEAPALVAWGATGDAVEVVQ